MTVPHISVGRSVLVGPTFRMPRPRPLEAPHHRAGGRSRPAAVHPATTAPRRMRVAWVDVLIQLVGIAMIVAAVWAVVHYALPQRGIEAFSGWYASSVAPRMSFDGVMVAPPEAPTFFSVAGDSMLVRPAG